MEFNGWLRLQKEQGQKNETRDLPLDGSTCTKKLAATIR